MTSPPIHRRTFLRRASAIGAVGIAGCGSRNPENLETDGDSRSDDRGDASMDADRQAEEPSPSLVFQGVEDDRGFTYDAVDRAPGQRKMIGDAGVYAVDYNRDGWTDLLLLGGERPILFENDSGHYREADVLPEIDRDIRVALFFDYDNDGFEDLLLLSTGEESIFLENTGEGFIRRSVGLEAQFDVPIAAAAGDYTGNGYPDVFVVQNGDWNAHNPKGLFEFPVPPESDNGSPNRLFAGDGSSYVETTEDAGITGEHWSLATSFVDLTGDGLADIHVANDFNRDAIYSNRGDGTFEKVWLDERTERNGMSSVVADVTGDGRLDILVTNIWFPPFVSDVVDTTMAQRADGNNLLVNLGDGTFVDRGDAFGLARGGWGWAGVVTDLNNDGYLDVVHATQRQRFSFPDDRISAAERASLHRSFAFYEHPAVFEGTADGFRERPGNAIGFGRMDGRGMATADFDRDGRPDLVFADVAGPFHLYRNVSDAGNAVQVDVRGTRTTPALGATVDVATDDRTYHQVRNSRSDVLSQSTRVFHFGVGEADAVSVHVIWPDGTDHQFDEIASNQRLIVNPDGIVDAIDLRG